LAARREVASDALETVLDTEGLRGGGRAPQRTARAARRHRLLAEPQRAALLLAELEDFPQRRIAEVLGTSESRVKALVFRARQALMADRAARAVPCGEIRAELAVALRPGPPPRIVAPPPPPVRGLPRVPDAASRRNERRSPPHSR
jgi:hypothetical protein